MIHESSAFPMQKLLCRNLWKIFGKSPEKALAALTANEHSGDKLAYPDHVAAVCDVGFHVDKGETFVVMGLSGSGKSTLIRCLARLTEPTAGEILIDGDDLRKMNEAQLREVRRHKISMVFQNFGLLPHRRVLDNVAYGLEVCGVPKNERNARAMQMIELVGLKNWESKYPRQLSGGMQQRVGLARALTVNPEILFFDEPFSALDPLIRREMQDELLRLQSQLHKTSVFITHDFAEALKLGDRIAIMRDGRFVQEGTPQELVLHPKDDYVRAFVQDAPRAKVITAQTIMQPCGPDFVANGHRVSGDTHLEALLPMLALSDAPLAVTQADHSVVIGQVDRATVLQALVNDDAVGERKP